MVLEQAGVFPYMYLKLLSTAFQESYQTASMEKEQLQTELDTTKHVSRAKDQQISIPQRPASWSVPSTGSQPVRCSWRRWQWISNTVLSDEDTSTFRFIIAKCSHKELPYRFQGREGVFKPHTQYATIKLKQFLLVGEVSPEGAELCYTTVQFYKQVTSTVNVDFLFVVIH